MSCTKVGAHTRNGHKVRAYTRQTTRSAVADVLARDLHKVYEETDCELAARLVTGPICGDGRSRRGKENR